MKKRLNPKYLEICFYAFALVAAILIFNEILSSLGDLLAAVSGWASAIWSAISAVVWGAVIAYILYPLTHWVEKRPLGWIKKYPKLRRLLSISLVYLSILALIVWGIAFLVPEIIVNLKELWTRVPTYIAQVETFLNNNVRASDWWNSAEVQSWLDTQIQTLVTNLEGTLQTALPSIFAYVARTISGIFMVVLALMASFFILMDRDNLGKSINRMTLSIFPRDRANKVLGFMKRADSVFGRYLVGKLNVALILSVLAYIAMVIMGVQYSPLMSVLVGFTNMIPYIGPWIGAFPILLLTALDDPSKLLEVAILLVALQAVENFFLSPKILADSTGLSPFWVLVAVTVGGSLFGIMGMILAVPVLALIRLSIEEIMDRRKTVSDKRLMAQQKKAGQPPDPPQEG